MQTVPGFDLFEPIDVLVLGVGNILWADEGFGVRAVEAFNARYKLPEKTKVADGGTLGMYLLELIGSTKDLLLFDCADLQEKPGTLKLLTNDEVKFWSATKISPHQTGMNEVLALAELQGHAPERIAVVAIQPEILQDYGGSLTPACEAALDARLRWIIDTRLRIGACAGCRDSQRCADRLGLRGCSSIRGRNSGASG